MAIKKEDTMATKKDSKIDTKKDAKIGTKKEDEIDTKKEDALENASFLSRLTLWWIVPLLRDGCKRSLEKEDLFKTRPQDQSSMLGDLVGSNWENEIALSKEKGRKPNYIHALVKSFGLYYIAFGVFAFLEECVFRICTPVFLGYYIRYFNGVPGYTATEAYLWALGIVLANVLILVSHHPFFYGVMSTGMRIRIASCSLIYRKALRLSTKALGQTTIGQLVNLLSNDVNRFDTSVIFIHYLWIGPTQTLISIIILWREIGPSCLAGLVPLFLYVPLQSFMGKMFSKLRLQTALRTDERIRIMNEMASAIRVIKMYAWEKPFRKVVEETRRLEIDVILKSNYFRAVNLTLFYTSAKIILFISFLVYVLTGNILTAEKVFLTTALINNIRLTMTLFFSFGVSLGSETVISCKRIQKFLEMEERVECDKVNTSSLRPKLQHCYVDGYNIYARWDSRNNEDNLNNVSFSVRAGEVMAVIGPVGSGKSSLLHAILTELPIKEGQINIRGRVSYASQEPWLFNGTVRDNILFGQPYSAKRYNEVVKVCALERDMELFPQGDLTHVGDRGVSLSGGQKARINLARAVYFDADIYLLDDPLSAVDAHVGNHLYDECILGFLQGKAVILATHQLQFLNKTSHILVLNSNGFIAGEGTHTQLKRKGIDFADIVSSGEEDMNANRAALEDKEDLLQSFKRLRRASVTFSAVPGMEEFGEDAFDNQSAIATSAMGGSVVSIGNESYYDDESDEDENQQQKGAELKSSGSVSLKMYSKYFLAGGGVFGSLVFVFSCFVTQAFYSGSDYWLSRWTNNEQLRGNLITTNNLTKEHYGGLNSSTVVPIIEFTDEDRFRYVYVYSGITVVLLGLSMFRTVHLFKICMTASKNLHNRMFAAVVNVPIVFFETRPIGQILNRFTKDTGQVDDLLPPALYDFLTIFLQFLGILVIILYLNIYLIIPTIILTFGFVFVRWVYICSARDIKRLEGITRSPVFSHLSTTFHGLPTIRAFQAQGSSSHQFDDHQDLHTSCWFLFIASSRLFGVWLDFLSLILITIVTYSFMYQEGVLGGDVGLGLSMVMLLSGMLQWGVRQSAEVENHMTSVERIIEYSKLESEVPKNAILSPKKESWPDKGQLTFENVYLYYDQNEPPVLSNLNFTIQPTEKIGIVGRTGAGKSSLLSCLFLLTPPQGEIIIDGVKTNSLLLEDLRRSISIIPQDPTLFTGTVRYNLDPFSEYSDEQLWNTLEEVQLKEHVKDMNGHLESQISEGGSNLSVGQRQLVCLARAILKHNKILVMDEATANVDPQTDNWIQDTIRQKFTDCTVLTIAHRLHTIMDSDRVMVMDSGKLKEFDTPHKLLQRVDSIFTDLVNQTGSVTAEQLRRIAEETHRAKNEDLSEVFTHSIENFKTHEMKKREENNGEEMKKNKEESTEQREKTNGEEMKKNKEENTKQKEENNRIEMKKNREENTKQREENNGEETKKNKERITKQKETNNREETKKNREENTKQKEENNREETKKNREENTKQKGENNREETKKNREENTKQREENKRVEMKKNKEIITKQKEDNNSEETKKNRKENTKQNGKNNREEMKKNREENNGEETKKNKKESTEQREEKSGEETNQNKEENTEQVEENYREEMKKNNEESTEQGEEEEDECTRL